MLYSLRFFPVIRLGFCGNVFDLWLSLGLQSASSINLEHHCGYERARVAMSCFLAAPRGPESAFQAPSGFGVASTGIFEAGQATKATFDIHIF